ncbi:glycerol dehydrogenase [Ruminococcaceae bacterium OttesenSCG-928-I18]|nr:glycerol dehydrogenase [Ruminococcaceae bacterium OttesenSCG-928-I18]
MIKILSTSKFFQGFDAFDSLGEYAKDFGKNFMVLSDPIFEMPDFPFLQQKKKNIEKSFADNGLKLEFKTFKGEVTNKEIDRVSKMMKEGGYDGLLALGGGKVVDTAKPVALAAGVPLVVAPTVIATNAPCSSATVIYTEDHNVDDVLFAPTGPSMVIVDTNVILNAPRVSLIAGMGDALPTFFEGRVNFEHGTKTIVGGDVSMIGMGLAEMCYQSLLENGELALKAFDDKIMSPYFERIVQTNTYLSCMAFEATGLSCAHSIEDAINTIPEAQKVLHGYRVAYGTLCLILLEDRPMEEFLECQEFCAKVGLPITLAEQNVTENVEEKIRGILSVALDDFDGCYNMPPNANEETMYNAIMMADKLGRDYLATHKS